MKQLFRQLLAIGIAVTPLGFTSTADAQQVVAGQEIQNPVIFTDVPDIDIIRVGKDYYMTSTTMHLCPGVPVMHSTDLVHWETINYVYDILETNGKATLNGGEAYGNGSWASSIKYVNGTYHICFVANEQNKSYIYHTKDLRSGKWTRSDFQGKFHDPALLFDEASGRAFVAYGNGRIMIRELTPDFTAVKEGGVDQLMVDARDPKCGLQAEGSHLYKFGDYYYLFNIDWPQGSVRREVCFRTKDLLGEWEKRTVVEATVNKGVGGFGGNGIAQGGIVDTPDGKWVGFFFQDQGPLGRAPIFIPMEWKDGWPTFPTEYANSSSPTVGTVQHGLTCSDDFNGTYNPGTTNCLAIGPAWQWNHNPVNDKWSLTERVGWLRLKTAAVAPHIFLARNSISQRLPGPRCTTEVLLDTKGMQAGDRAGICAFQSNYASIGVEKSADGKKQLVVRTRSSRGKQRSAFIAPTDDSEVAMSLKLKKDKVYLRISYVFYQKDGQDEKPNTARLAYSYDGKKWTDCGVTLHMQYTLDIFMGYRTLLYNYATTALGGYVDFDYYHVTID